MKGDHGIGGGARCSKLDYPELDSGYHNDELRNQGAAWESYSMFIHYRNLMVWMCGVCMTG